MSKYVVRQNRQHHSGSERNNNNNRKLQSGGNYAPNTSFEFQTCHREVFVLLPRIPANRKTNSEPKYDRDDVVAGVRLQFDGI